MQIHLKFKKISTLLAFMISGLSIMCCIVLSATIAIVSWTEKVKEYTGLITHEAGNISTEIGHVIASRQGQVESTARLGIFPLTEEGELDISEEVIRPVVATLDRMAQTDPEVARYVLIKPDGEGVTSEFRYVSLAERNYFKQSVTGVAATPEFLASQSTGKLTIMYSSPITDEFGNVLGVLVLGVDGSSLSNLVRNVSLGTEHPFLINNDGYIIADVDEDKIKNKVNILEQEGLEDFAEKMLSSNEVVVSRYTIDGEDKLVSTKKIPGTDWTAVTPVSMSEVAAAVKALSFFAIIITLIIIAISILVAIYLAHRISTPINTVELVVDDISKGVINRKSIELLKRDNVLNRDDEIGALGTSITNLLNKTFDMISSLQNMGKVVTQGVENITRESQNVSMGANEQASAAEEISSTMEEMVANIKHSSDNAIRTAAIAGRSTENGQRGADSVEQTVAAMKDIEEKISVIEDISQQTNILALNASVEAARAGEQGKGFAVVAREVRNLAELSRDAATQINELSAKGSQLSEESGKIIAELLPEIQETGALVKEIATASSEQETGAEQINIAIQRMDNVTQKNAAAAEQLADMAAALNKQAKEMQEIVNFYQLIDDDK